MGRYKSVTSCLGNHHRDSWATGIQAGWTERRERARGWRRLSGHRVLFILIEFESSVLKPGGFAHLRVPTTRSTPPYATSTLLRAQCMLNVQLERGGVWGGLDH